MPNIETPAARNSDSISSHIAADEITKSGKRHAQKIMIVKILEGLYRQEFISREQGITSMELSVRAGLDRYIVARRLPDAALMGEVTKGDKDHSRLCIISKRQAMEWWPSEAFMDECDKEKNNVSS